MINVRYYERQTQLVCDTTQQIQQRDGVRASRYGDERLSRPSEEPVPANVRQQPCAERL